MNMPKVGDNVNIVHYSAGNGLRGDVAKLERDNSKHGVTRTINAVYLGSDGEFGYSIRDNCGEQWNVIPAGEGKWKTIIPRHERAA